MEIKVYADVLFFTNLLMDYALLYISLKLLKAEINTLKLIIAAVVGALYGVFAFFINIMPVFEWLLKFAAASLMVFISFSPKRILLFIKYVLIFLAVSFCAGGIAFSVLYSTPLGTKLGAVFSGGTVYVNIPVYKLFFVCIACYFFMSIFSHVSKKYSLNAKKIYDVSIISGDNKACFKAFLDSGNFLTEPKSGITVMIVRKGICDFLTKDKTAVPIFYRSLSGDGEIQGFIPDKIIINNKTCTMYVAISDISFGDGFDAILPCNFDERME